MQSRITPNFVKLFKKLPLRVQKQAKASYKIWKKDPYNSLFNFKKVGQKGDMLIYSIRTGSSPDSYRALGMKKAGTNIIDWFWIGSHEDYNKLV